jgi:KDEL-tailed cysteine endopeptidase
MKFTLAALLGVTAANLDSEAAFMEYVSTTGRSYGTRAEFDFRLNIFKARVVEHERHNSEVGQTSTQGVNFLTDRTEEEISRLMGWKDTNTTRKAAMPEEDIEESILAAGVDWRTMGVLTPIKNQGHCGSCWAFSTTGAMEASHAIKSGTVLSLSEQQLVDCNPLCFGCSGGNMEFAFEYTEFRALELESEYPYNAVKGKCVYDKTKGKVLATTWHAVTPLSPGALKKAILKTPVSVALKADQPAFHQYTGGVITSGCTTPANHGVLAVGFGTDSTGQEYYIVKNSWGADWGDHGFVRIGVKSNIGVGICSIQ